MVFSLTAVYKKVPGGFIGFVEELPGANTQGYTIEEVKSNLLEAVQMVFEANKQLAEKDISDEYLRESFDLTLV